MLQIFDDISQQIWYNKYRYGNEETIQDTYNRVAKAIADNKEEEKEFKSILGKFLPGGRILSNAGTTRKKVLLFNCTVIAPPFDSIEGIMDSLKEFALIIRQGGGVGMSLDSLRPAGAFVNGIEATSSGAISFAKIWNEASKTISSAGSRRAALILIMNYQHPEVSNFICVKSKHNELTKANLSVGVDKSFINLIKKRGKIKQYHWVEIPYNKSYETVPDDATPYIYFSQEQIKEGQKFNWRGESYVIKIYTTIEAVKLWDTIVTHMYRHAEPGLLFLDNINKLNNLREYEWLHTTNPCITGDTLIAVADGRGAIPIKQLAEMGKDVPVYCIDKENGEAHISVMRNPRLTRKMEDVYKIKFKEGGEVKCSADHVFYTRWGIPKKAKDITAGDKMLGKHISNIIIGEELSSNSEVESVEPAGQQDVYNGTVDKFHTYGITIGDKVVFSQNCGEVPLPASVDQYYGVCCLGSMVLPKFLREKNNKFEFDYDNFAKAVRIAVKFLSNVNYKSNYVFDGQREEVMSKRRIGLGLTGIADVFVALGVRYGSKQSINLLNRINETLVRESYLASVNLVDKYGIFPLLKKMGKETFAKQCLPARLGMNDVVDAIKKKGIANSHLLSIAPTGSLSLLAGNVSSGIEPIFREEYTRNIVTNISYSRRVITKCGKIFLCNDNELKEIEEQYGITNIQPANLTQFSDGSFTYQITTKDYLYGKYPDYNFEYFVEAKDVSVDEHLAIMQAMQRYVDSSISKTMVLPSSANIDDLKDLLFKSHEMNLKGITVYVEGSREAVIETKEKQSTKKADIDYEKQIAEYQNKIEELENKLKKNTFKRPIKMLSNTWKINFANHSALITVGEVNHRPKEVIINMGRSGSTESALCEAIGRLSSAMLQDGYDIQYVSKRLLGIQDGSFIWHKISNRQKKPVLIYSVPDAIGKILVYAYDDDKITDGMECPNCKLNSVITQDGCKTCISCGWSQCE